MHIATQKHNVLLLGNGINRAFDAGSWDSLIREISGKADFKSNLPFPQQIIAATENTVDISLKKFNNKMFGSVGSDELRTILRSILAAGFDDILTTNYSYELEIAATNHNGIYESAIKKIQEHSRAVKNAEGVYMLHTYNSVEYEGALNRIWHIHGEARKPSSMVIGHYFYCNLVSKYKRYLDGIQNSYEKSLLLGKEIAFDSWLDGFIMGNVYVLGFGFDPSEIDLWWLLERKRREKASHGKVFFYCPSWERLDPNNKDKFRLLECHDVCICSSNLTSKAKDYREFYFKAIKEITKRI